jgi:hypothetical protein
MLVLLLVLVLLDFCCFEINFLSFVLVSASPPPPLSPLVLQACQAQPRASTGWLEWSKMEEENGRLLTALHILILGLKMCNINEAILTKVRNCLVLACSSFLPFS